jgi:hypothetical protein
MHLGFFFYISFGFECCLKLNRSWFGCYLNVHAKNSSSLGIYFKGLMLNFVLEFELNVFPCTSNHRFFKFSAHMDFGSSAKLLRLWICVKLICWYFCKNWDFSNTGICFWNCRMCRFSPFSLVYVYLISINKFIGTRNCSTQCKRFFFFWESWPKIKKRYFVGENLVVFFFFLSFPPSIILRLELR